jgi:exoribonuclease R
MFIFQNDRGKEPSTLEKVKAEMMFAVHAAPPEEKDEEERDICGTIKGGLKKSTNHWRRC